MAQYKSVKPATFTLPIGLLEDLDALSRELGKKKTAIVAEALEMYMDYQDLQLAVKRLEDPAEERLSHEEFVKAIGLE
jgi:predicted DNA-binding protein